MKTPRIPLDRAPGGVGRGVPYRILGFLLVLCISENLLLGEDDAPAAARQQETLGRELFDRLLAERENLVSGKYSARGRYTKAASEYGPEIDGEVVVHCAFDYERGLLRWEREEPRVFRDGPEKLPTQRQTGYRFIRTPERCYAQDLFEGLTVTHSIRIEPPDFQPKHLGVPYDVRTFGLAGWSSVDHPEAFDHLKTRFAAFADIAVKELDGGDVELRCKVGEGTEQPWRVDATFRIDPARGDTATQLQLDHFDGTKNLWTKLNDQTEVTWEERNGVWVPTELRLERQYGSLETYEIELEWDSVNEELGDEEFQPQALHVSVGAYLVDRRFGKPVTLGDVFPRAKRRRPIKNQTD